MRFEASRVIVAAAVVAAFLPGPRATAGQAPNPVSPGAAAGLTRVAQACPTFHWTAASGTEPSELVIYAIGSDETESEQVLRRRLPSGATGWTPALDECLERGGRYAWSIRAAGDDKTSTWSVPYLFEVAEVPSRAEFETALEMVRQYLGRVDEVAGVTGRAVDEEVARGSATSSAAPRAVGPPMPLLEAAGDASLMVNGAAVVTTATLSPGICRALSSSFRYIDNGDGTVYDCNTGLLWLKDANCLELANVGGLARAGWLDALAAAAALSSGTCGLTDGSQPGDWRLPAISELCSGWVVGDPCPESSAGDSLVDTSLSGDPFVRNATGKKLWTEGDLFVNVQSNNYWSSTEASDTSKALAVELLLGTIGEPAKTGLNGIWPVRDGQ